MSSRKVFGSAITLVLVLAGVSVWYLFNPPPPTARTPLRVGWQSPWATQGQVIQAMSRTNIPELTGSPLAFQAFVFGPDLNEAAVAGRLDVTNSGIVPIVNLLAKSDDWDIVARLIDFPITLMVRRDSHIATPHDLAGKTIGVPFGGGSHPFAIEYIRRAGLRVGTGADAVTVINVKPTEMPIAFEQGTIDGAACWEHTTTLLKDRGGEPLEEVRYVSFVMVSRAAEREHSGEVVDLLAAYILAHAYVATHREQTDGWFSEASNMEPSLLRRIKVIEPNLNVRGPLDVTIDITSADLAFTQSVADTMLELKLIPRRVSIADHIQTQALARARERLTRMPSTFGEIRPRS